MRGATAEQIEPIAEAIRSIQAETEDFPLANALHVALTHFVPGVRFEMIGWVQKVIAVEIGSARGRGYEHLLDRLENVLDSLCDLRDTVD